MEVQFNLLKSGVSVSRSEFIFSANIYMAGVDDEDEDDDVDDNER